MATNGVNFTYGDQARREDLLDVLTNIDPTEDRLFKLFGKTTAYNTLHEWPIKSLETVGDNAQVEGSEAPADASENPGRLQNITQIFSKTAKVSGTEQAVTQAGFSDRMALEIVDKMKALSNDVEFALVRGSIASGVASDAGAGSERRLEGVKNWISTNNVNHSGATLTETRFNDQLESQWQQGGKATVAVTSMKGKRRISGFTAGSTKNIDAEDKKLVNSVAVYESDSADTVRLYAHRYVTMSGDYTGNATPGFDVITVQDDLWKVSILQGREPKTEDLAKSGDYTRKQILTELTLESRAEQGSAIGKVFF